MIRSLKVVAASFLLLFCSALIAQSQETRSVTAEGVAVVQGNARDIARDQALEDAQKRAVEQAVGLLIDSQTQVENYQLISDRILSQTKGYITRYNIAGESMDSGLLRVRINAEVSLAKLTDDLSGIGILLGQMHKPRTIILIAEQNIGHEWYAWWWGYHGQQVDMGVVENTFMDAFTQKGFEFIDQSVAAKQIEATSAYKIQDLTATQAKSIGGQVDAEVVIVGKALAKLYGDIGGGMKSVQADLSAKAVRTDTGQVIAAVTTHAAAVHITPETAGIEALKKAANDASNQMIEKILAIYSKEAGGTRSVNITVTGLNKTQFVKFKDVLRNQVRGIKDLHERGFSGNTAKISVDSKSSAQVLSDDLLLKDFGTFDVEVTSSTANSIELRVGPKGSLGAMAPAPRSSTAAASPADVPVAPAAPSGYLEAEDYLVFNGDNDMWGRVGKMLTEPTQTSPEGEFLMYHNSSKHWSKFYKTIKPAIASDLKPGARVWYYRNSEKDGVYHAPADQVAIRTGEWCRALVTDNSMLKSRGIVTIGGSRVDAGNVFIEMK